ncbi:MAG: response regulator transcription factor [Ignavibacteria bacterium]|nr:response regulator transcription factor [Ignavibacteria bacterium]
MESSILLVEDDANLGSILQEYLQLKGYKVTLMADGELGWEEFNNKPYDLCVLDVMMPKKDGFELAKQIREKNRTIPIIFLTAKGMKEDKIEGFSIGADDYVTKPFSADELLCRIQAVLRRCLNGTSNTMEEDQFIVGDYSFDYQQRLLQIGVKQQPLTSKEADLLKLLCQYKNNVLRREVALKQIWGNDSYFNGRSMDVFITKLRKYMKEDHTVEIVNVHGTGYKLSVLAGRK